jgi:hypothetical protein
MDTDKEWYGCDTAWFVSDVTTQDFRGLKKFGFMIE